MKSPRYPKLFRAAMLRNEREVLAHIRHFGVYNPFLCSMAWYNAIDRLKAKGVIRWSKVRYGYYIVRRRA